MPRGGTAAALRRRVAGFDSARDYFLHYGAALDEYVAIGRDAFADAHLGDAVEGAWEGGEAPSLHAAAAQWLVAGTLPLGLGFGFGFGFGSASGSGYG